MVDEGYQVTLPVNGISMLPFIIGGKESVNLVRPGVLQQGDIVLAWVDGCRFVIHRIIDIRQDQLTLMGEGNLKGKEHCHVSDVKARAIHVIDSKGQQHDLYTPLRRFAFRVWWVLRPFRRIILGIYRRL